MKSAYRAIRHLTALFDDTVRRVPDFEAEIRGGNGRKYAIFGYRAGDGGPLVTIWRSGDRPGEHPEMEHVSLTLPGFRFDEPLWVDLLTGRVYDVEGALGKTDGDGTTFQRLSVYDSPVVLVDRSTILDAIQPVKAAGR